MSEKLIHGHSLFRERYFNEHEFWGKLAHEGQRPGALFIGCSDSRVVPEFLTNSGFGELFVLRNVANYVPVQAHTDASVGAAIEYAVRHLRVPDIVVCGHYGCGGVQAALTDMKHLTRDTELTEWLRGVQPAAERARALGHTSGEALWRAAVEENVLDALENLITFDAVIEALEAERLHLHGWVYDIAKGCVLAFDAEADGFVDVLERYPRPG